LTGLYLNTPGWKTAGGSAQNRTGTACAMTGVPNQRRDHPNRRFLLCRCTRVGRRWCVAHIELVLRYGDYEAKVAVPLGTDLPEVLRRVKLKKGDHPLEEASGQIADVLRDTIYDQRLIRQMLKDIIRRL